MFEQFKSKVFADKIDSLKSYKETELKSRWLNKAPDTLAYQWASEIIDECEFPHAIRGMEPT